VHSSLFPSAKPTRSHRERHPGTAEPSPRGQVITGVPKYSSCVGCHEGEDVHLQRLGPACEECHNPNGWSFWRFDHDSQTEFPLDGAHTDLVCHACHRASLASEIDLPRHCQGCHARDDVHSGAFGRSCERCHRDTSWEEIEVIR
jgi:hypothetical protein